MITTNSIVKLRGEEGLYRVIESNGDRLIVSPLEWNYPIIPQEVVHESDIENVVLDSGIWQLAQNKMGE